MVRAWRVGRRCSRVVRGRCVPAVGSALEGSARRHAARAGRGAAQATPAVRTSRATPPPCLRRSASAAVRVSRVATARPVWSACVRWACALREFPRPRASVRLQCAVVSLARSRPRPKSRARRPTARRSRRPPTAWHLPFGARVEWRCPKWIEVSLEVLLQRESQRVDQLYTLRARTPRDPRAGAATLVGAPCRRAFAPARNGSRQVSTPPNPVGRRGGNRRGAESAEDEMKGGRGAEDLPFGTPRPLRLGGLTPGGCQTWTRRPSGASQRASALVPWCADGRSPRGDKTGSRA